MLPAQLARSMVRGSAWLHSMTFLGRLVRTEISVLAPVVSFEGRAVQFIRTLPHAKSRESLFD